MNSHKRIIRTLLQNRLRFLKAASRRFYSHVLDFEGEEKGSFSPELDREKKVESAR